MISDKDKIMGILLAAGSSQRFGGNKLLVTTPQNEIVAVQSCRHLLSVVDKVLAIIRPGAKNLGELLEKTGAIVAICPKAEEGMGTSLAFGISSSPDADGWIIALADMPWIKPESYRKIADAIYSGVGIAAPVCQGKRGHPVGFSNIFRNELLALRGDTGAKKILAQYSSQIHYIECNDPGILRDIDIPADLDGQSK